MRKVISVGGVQIGYSNPAFLIAEIGINHNGDLQNALELMDLCKQAGFDAVKFQKRDPDTSTPEGQKSQLRDTPWGEMTYLDYKKRIEFGYDEYATIKQNAAKIDIIWFASPWDIPSAEFLYELDVPVFKIASASVTDKELLEYVASTGIPTIMSTGMSTDDEIRSAIGTLNSAPLALLQATSSYPMKPEEANLRYMDTLRELHSGPVGYSGHEPGLQVSLAAIALGANVLERHVTLNRTMWGTDQAASLEPRGFQNLVRDVRIIESAIGDGIKRVYDSEIQPRLKLRRVK